MNRSHTPTFKSLFKWLVLGSLLCAQASAALNPVELECDQWQNPVGIDSVHPKLSWKLESTGGSTRQSAYRILCATEPSMLEVGKVDLWDSGKVNSEQQLDVLYDGEPLTAAQRVYWKVQSWDEEGNLGSWSKTGSWVMGLLNASDWEDSQWISHPDWLAVNRAQIGYKSKWADTVDTEKWIMIDLGKIYSIDRINLMALRHTVVERLGFPLSFKVEIADSEDFEDAYVVVDYTEEPFSNIWIGSHSFEVDGMKGRFVRVVAPKLRKVNGQICLAFNQIEVLSNGENVALHKKVIATDYDEDPLWSPEAVVDGKGLPSSNPLSTKTLLVRKDVRVKPDLRHATLFVSGLGQYVFSINGQRVGDYKLHPGWTDTDKTVFYDGFDVTSLLKAGENGLGVMLGNGMYNVGYPGERYTKFIGRYRPLQMRCLLILDYNDGSRETVASNPEWKTQVGPTTYAHIYGGEDFDARRVPLGWNCAGFNDQDWVSCAVSTITEPKGTVYGISEAAPPLKVIESIPVKDVNEINVSTAVYDFGQNTSSIPFLKVKGKAGSKVRIIPAELLKSDGSVDRLNISAGIPAYWEYTLNGSGGLETWEPEFFYQGARYYQVERFAADGSQQLPEVVELNLEVMHSSSKLIGDFRCSSELFNRIRDLVRWAQRSNMMSVLTDCPHREKLGWLEQYHLNGAAMRYEWALGALYTKDFQDMADAQTAEGLIPDIAPEYIIFPEEYRDSPEWGCAFIISAWQQWVWTGDSGAFRKYSKEMMAYIDYLVSKSDGFILDYGLGDWCDLGPGRRGYGQLTPQGLTSTAIFYEAVDDLLTVATELDLPVDVNKLTLLKTSIRDAFNHKFFHPETGNYANGSQTSNAMPYDIGMIPDGYEAQVFSGLVDSMLATDCQLTSGEIGHPYLLRALAKGGRSDLVYRLHHQDTRPGYGYQLKLGATSLTENWDGRASQNHFMFGHITEWFYGYLAGILPDPEHPGFKSFVLDPQYIEGIDWVSASYDSRYGEIGVDWHRVGDASVRLKIRIPANTTAQLNLGLTENWNQETLLNLSQSLPEGRGSIIEIDHRYEVKLPFGDYDLTVLLKGNWQKSN